MGESAIDEADGTHRIAVDSTAPRSGRVVAQDAPHEAHGGRLTVDHAARGGVVVFEDAILEGRGGVEGAVDPATFRGASPPVGQAIDNGNASHDGAGALIGSEDESSA